MTRIILAGLLLIVFAGNRGSSVPWRSSSGVVLEAEPDPTLARELRRWPNADDLARLQSVEGKPKAVILQVLGHPCRVERRPDGEEVWDYPWCAACRVWVREGVCTGTFYTAGY
ncbi:MAG TPA: hypothetical protein VH575_15720 [Gemmataceae bacterium]|jgi:hypothetical protein